MTAALWLLMIVAGGSFVGVVIVPAALAAVRATRLALDEVEEERDRARPRTLSEVHCIDCRFFRYKYETINQGELCSAIMPLREPFMNDKLACPSYQPKA